MLNFRKAILYSSFTMLPMVTFSQIKPLDATLSNYQYPFEVHYLEPSISEAKSENGVYGC